MKKNISKIAIIILLGGFLILPFSGLAYTGQPKENFPKLANYYLSWEIPNTDVNELAKWDVLILDMEVQHNSLANLKKIKQLNPHIIILAYVTSEEIKYQISDTLNASLRYKLLNQIDSASWLKDSSGTNISFWPGTRMLNLAQNNSASGGQPWNELLPQFVNDNIISTGLWDGVFYDNVWPDLSWLNNGNVDIDNDGDKESKSEIDKQWLAGTKKMMQRTQDLIGGNYLVMANSRYAPGYQSFLNGIMLESFPAPWEDGGTWYGSMKTMTSNKDFKQPKIMVVNANTDNTWNSENYRKMRFSLASDLLGGAYFSFDYGVNSHNQTWWYDEYNIDLGKEISSPINILDKKSSAWKNGLWRRDFTNGIAIVNSTNEIKNYVFTDEIFDKINGTQDLIVNNGARVNMVSINPKDGIILLGDLQNRKIPTTEVATPAKPAVSAPAETAVSLIKDHSYKNGLFYRVFSTDGQQVQNGFFAYNEKYPGGAQVISTDIDNDGQIETLVNNDGSIFIYRQGNIVKAFKPFDGKFKGDISIAAVDFDGNGQKEIVVGAGQGGGPQIRIFSNTGKLLNGGWFAYDRNFRGGVNLSVADVNGDGQQEIVAGSGVGGGPQVRIFNRDGRLLNSWFAYDKNLRGGVFVTAGNISGKGDEIVTGAGQGTLPEVRIFSAAGNLLGKFYAYDKDVKSGIKVTTSDINNDGIDEILAGSLQ